MGDITKQNIKHSPTLTDEKNCLPEILSGGSQLNLNYQNLAKLSHCINFKNLASEIIRKINFSTVTLILLHLFFS